MILLRVSIRDYRIIRTVDLDFTEITAAAIAGRNGEGKSSLIEAIWWCLFGRSRSGFDGPRVIRHAVKRASVEVEVEVAGAQWKVTRTQTRSSQDVQLWFWTGVEWENRSGKTAKRGTDTTQDRIVAALKVSYEILMAGPVAMQDDSDRFARAAPEDRREVVRQILNLDEYKRLATEATQQANATMAEATAATRLVPLIEALDESLALSQAVRASAEVAAGAAANALEAAHIVEADARRAEGVVAAQAAEAQTAQAQLPALRASRDACAQARHAAAQEVNRLILVVEGMPALQARAVKLPVARQADASARDALQAAVTSTAERERLVARREELSAVVAAETGRMDAARAELEHCPRLEAVVATIPVLEARLAQVRGTLAAATDAERALLEAVGDIDNALDVAASRDARVRALAQQAESEAAVAAARQVRDNAREVMHTAERTRHQAGVDHEQRQSDLSTVQERAGLLSDVPCTAHPEWTGPRGFPCDLAGTCPLLADAHGAAGRVEVLAAELLTSDEKRALAEQAWIEASAHHVTTCQNLYAVEEHLGLVQESLRRADTALATARQVAQARACDQYATAQRTVQQAQGALDDVTSDWHEAQGARQALAALQGAQGRLDAATQAHREAACARFDIDDQIACLQVPDQAQLRLAVTRAEAALQDAMDATAQLTAASAATAQLEAARASYTARTADLTTAQEKVDAASQVSDAPIRALEAACTRVREAAQARAGCARALEQARDVLRDIQGTQARDTAERVRLQGEIDRGAVHAERARLYQRTSDALTIAAIDQVERALPLVESAANAVLSMTSSRGMTVHLRTQRVKRDGTGVIETLDIVVQDNEGTRLREDLSGGEKFRVDMALRLGLARLLSDREGTPVDFVIIDEGGIGSLDLEGANAVKEVVAGLQRMFKLVLLVTHIPDVAECLPVRIQMQLTDQGSIVEVQTT